MKKFPVFLLTFLFCSVVFSAQKSKSKTTSKQIQRLENLEQEMNSILSEKPQVFSFAPSNFLTESCPWNLYASALLWHAKGGNFDWAILLDTSYPPINGKMYTLGFDWDLGFRCGLQRLFSPKGWVGTIEYTQFNTADGQKVSALTALPENAPQGSTAPTVLSEAKFNGNVKYSAILATLSKSFFLSRYSSLSPIIGVASSFINQKDRLLANNLVSAEEAFIPVSGSVNTALEEKNKTSGIGPYIGLEADFFLNKKLSLFCECGTSFFWTYFKVNQHQSFSATLNAFDPVQTSLNLNLKSHSLVPFSKLKLGFNWTTKIAKTTALSFESLICSISYELNYFWKINQMLNEINISPNNATTPPYTTKRLYINRLSEDLAFYGITFNLGVTF